MSILIAAPTRAGRLSRTTTKGRSLAPERGRGRNSADRAKWRWKDREGSVRTNDGYGEVVVEEAIRALLHTAGENPERGGFVSAPGRMARSFKEIFAGLRQDPAGVFEAKFDIGHQEMIIVKDIPPYSACEYHLLPFHRHAHVAYIPNTDGRVTGLSKVVRLVDRYTHRLQVQGWIVTQVTEVPENRLGAKGVLAIIKVEHACMSMRGMNEPGSRTVTPVMREVPRN